MVLYFHGQKTPGIGQKPSPKTPYWVSDEMLECRQYGEVTYAFLVDESEIRIFDWENSEHCEALYNKGIPKIFIDFFKSTSTHQDSMKTKTFYRSVWSIFKTTIKQFLDKFGDFFKENELDKLLKLTIYYKFIKSRTNQSYSMKDHKEFIEWIRDNWVTINNCCKNTAYGADRFGETGLYTESAKLLVDKIKDLGFNAIKEHEEFNNLMFIDIKPMKYLLTPPFSNRQNFTYLIFSTYAKKMKPYVKNGKISFEMDEFKKFVKDNFVLSKSGLIVLKD